MFDNVITRVGFAIVFTSTLIILILGVLPVYPIPTDITNALDWLFESLWQWDFLIPTATLITCFGLILMTDLLLIGVKLILFIKKHITQQH